MQCKIFNCPTNAGVQSLQQKINDWLNQHNYMIHNQLVTTNRYEIYVFIFYSEVNTKPNSWNFGPSIQVTPL